MGLAAHENGKLFRETSVCCVQEQDKWKDGVYSMISHSNFQNPVCRDHSRYVPSQWDTTLFCNIVSHWLSPYPDDHWCALIFVFFSVSSTMLWKIEKTFQCATFPIDRGPDLGKNWVGLGKLSNLVARRSMVISCVSLYDGISGLYVYTVGLWWIILTLDRWSMTSANTISHTAFGIIDLHMWIIE